MTEFLQIYLFTALGVVISVILPILREALPKPSGNRSARESGFLPSLWKVAKPYVLLGLFSLIVALLLVAVVQDQLGDWRAALLAGYSADSTIQKLKG